MLSERCLRDIAQPSRADVLGIASVVRHILRSGLRLLCADDVDQATAIDRYLLDISMGLATRRTTLLVLLVGARKVFPWG